MLSWLYVAALFVLCGILGILQYRWIGEVSVAERERLRGSLQASLHRLSRDLNSEISADCNALLPDVSEPGAPVPEAQVAARYKQWKRTSRHASVFRQVAIARRTGDAVELRVLDADKGVFVPAEWPSAWDATRRRMEFRLSHNGRPNRDFPGPQQGPGPPIDEGLVFEMPLRAPGPHGPFPVPFGQGGAGWLIVELDPAYLRDTLLPEVLQRHLGSGGTLDYQVEVVTRTHPPSVVYQSDRQAGKLTARVADASVGILELRHEPMFPRRGPGPGDRDAGPPRGPVPDSGRWQLLVRHHAGSLEAVVARARWRNLAVTAGVLLLIVAALAAFVRFTRRAQKLAQLQIEFVAGVSHELRTPLAVIGTAAYNLQGRLAHHPAQVARYGELIMQETSRLNQMIEQVLTFAGTQAGRIIHGSEPVSVETVIEQTMESAKPIIQGSHCVIEKNIDPGLPRVMGDATALKHALENLLNNAVKYGSKDEAWIGISARQIDGNEKHAVEIRVADRGPGIPRDEQEHIFEAFFRGRSAVQDQVHGTGLGLHLVKKIVEAHGGSIRVKSEPMEGTEFILLFPAAPAGATG
jgi:signal transduction histidine kinase